MTDEVRTPVNGASAAASKAAYVGRCDIKGFARIELRQEGFHRAAQVVGIGRPDHAELALLEDEAGAKLRIGLADGVLGARKTSGVAGEKIAGQRVDHPGERNGFEIATGDEG